MKKNKILHLSGILEGMSLLVLLFIAMPLKYYAENATIVPITGRVHGVLFLAYIALLLFSYLKQNINLIHLLVGIVASVVPFGTFIYTAKMLKDDAVGGES